MTTEVAVAPQKVFRAHPTKRIPAAVDVIQSILGVKNGRQTWSAVKKRLPAIKEHVITHKERGGKVDYIDQVGFPMLVSDLRSNKAQGQEVLQKLRASALDIAGRYWQADPTLATEIVEMLDDPVQLEHIAQRAQSKLTQRMLTDAVKAAGGTGSIYATINDANNLAITGYRAKDLVAKRSQGKKRPTRDLLETDELIELQFLEVQERRAFKKLQIHGNEAILKGQKAVMEKFKLFNQ